MPIAINDKILKQSMYSPVCSHCDNLIDEVNRKCLAFNGSETIPIDIWEGRNKHKRPVKGDDDILFIPVTKEKLEQDLKATS